MKTISIFGSTGSVGQKMVNVVKQDPKHFKVICLTCQNNHKLIIEQAKLLHPKYVVYSGIKEHFNIVRCELKTINIETLPKNELCNAASIDVDIMGMAIAGTAGIAPSFFSLGHAKTLAIANKETLVSGGNLFINKAKLLNTKIIPVDSEHNAIYQCLKNKSINNIKKITITCSGGPFVDYSLKELKNITIKDALNHPNWKMGNKNTIDSATLINKVLEIIEATVLFTLGDINKVDSIIHTESIIHAMVYFKDSSVASIMSVPDMQIPVNHALSYRKNYDNPLELPETLSFRKYNDWQKNNVDIAYNTYQEKKCIALNTANEIAVTKFLNKKIRFIDIISIIKNFLNIVSSEDVKSLTDIIELENSYRENFKVLYD